MEKFPEAPRHFRNNEVIHGFTASQFFTRDVSISFVDHYFYKIEVRQLREASIETLKLTRFTTMTPHISLYRPFTPPPQYVLKN